MTLLDQLRQSPRPAMLTEDLKQLLAAEQIARSAYGVLEYWIVDTLLAFVEQYRLAGNQYRLAAKTGDGTLLCDAISGLTFPGRAAFDDAACDLAIAAIGTK